MLRDAAICETSENSWLRNFIVTVTAVVSAAANTFILGALNELR